VLDSSDTPAYHAYLLWLQNHPLFPLQTLPVPGTPQSFRQAIADRLKAAPDKSYAVQQFDAAFDLALKTEGTAQMTEADAAKAAYHDWSKKFPTYSLSPAALTDKQNVDKAIASQIENDSVAKGPPTAASALAWVSDYDALKNEGVMAFEKSRQETFRNLQTTIHDAGFDLVPRPLFERWEKDPVPYWARHFSPWFAHYLRHLLGVLITAGLLALGAPFWFNLLKNLMNLRPAVASLVEKRPQSTPALPTSPATPPSSS
jgi:hypothetical protein